MNKSSCQERFVRSIEPFICTGNSETETSFVAIGKDTIAVCALKDKTKRAAYWSILLLSLKTDIKY